MYSRFTAILCILALASCLNSRDYNLDTVSMTPELAFPLASGDIGLVDIVSSKDSSYLKVYPDGLLYFSYTQTLGSKDVRNLFNLPNTVSTTNFNLTAGTMPPASSDEPPRTVFPVVDLNLSPEKLSEAVLKGGSLEYAVNLSPANNVVPAGLPIEVVLTLTDVVDEATAEPLVISTGFGEGSASLKNHILKMSSNKFNIKVELIIKKHSGSFYVAPSTKISVRLSFEEMGFTVIRGFFGDQSVTLPAQTIPITIFNSSVDKRSMSFVSPQLKMKVVNENGVPCEVSFSKLEARKTGAVLPMQISPASPINLDFPVVEGTSTTNEVAITNTSAILNFSPDEFYYAASARINKGLTQGNNFMTDSSKLNVTLVTELPLYGHASDITMSDTLDVDLSGVQQSKVLKGTMQIKALNEMPLDAWIQLYLLDEQHAVIDSVFRGNQSYLVKASQVKSSGELDVAGVNDLKLELSSEMLSKLFNTRFVIVRAKLNTSKDQNGNLLNVKFNAAYRLKLNLGLLAKLDLVIK